MSWTVRLSLLRLKLNAAAAALLMDIVFHEALSAPLFSNLLSLVRAAAEAVSVSVSENSSSRQPQPQVADKAESREETSPNSERPDAFVGGSFEASSWLFLAWQRLWTVGLCMNPPPVEPWRAFLSVRLFCRQPCTFWRQRVRRRNDGRLFLWVLLLLRRCRLLICRPSLLRASRRLCSRRLFS